MTRIDRLRFSAVISSMVFLVPTPAFCADLYPLWELGVGVGGLTIPDYRGSDQQRAYAFPIPYFVYRGEIFQVDREKVRGLFFKTDRIELDVSLSGSVPVKSGDNKARENMPDLDPTLELGPQLNVLLTQSEKLRLRLHLPARAVFAIDTGFRTAEQAGWIINPILNLDIKDTFPGIGWNLGLSGGPLWASSQYHQYFYGVDEAFATPSRPAYSAPGGYSGTQFTVSLSKRFAKIWVGAFVRLFDLNGAAFEDSPLLRQNFSVTAGLGVSWIFAQSDKQVWAEE